MGMIIFNPRDVVLYYVKLPDIFAFQKGCWWCNWIFWFWLVLHGSFVVRSKCFGCSDCSGFISHWAKAIVCVQPRSGHGCESSVTIILLLLLTWFLYYIYRDLVPFVNLCWTVWINHRLRWELQIKITLGGPVMNTCLGLPKERPTHYGVDTQGKIYLC